MCGFIVSSLLKLLPTSNSLSSSPLPASSSTPNQSLPTAFPLQNKTSVEIDKEVLKENKQEEQNSKHIKDSTDEYLENNKEKEDNKPTVIKSNSKKEREPLVDSKEIVNNSSTLKEVNLNNKRYKKDVKTNIQTKNSKDLDNRIHIEVSRCNEYMLKMAPVSQSVKDHIKNVAVYAFNSKDINARIYGSMATSLALPESDLDIVLLGLKITNREELIDAINKLSETLLKQNYVSSCKSITTARTPVIKLNINLEKLNRSEVTKQLKVDIIIQHYEDNILAHPIICAWWTSRYVREMPYFQAIVLVLKKLVKAKGLNKPFVGDPSSYIISLMVSAFLNTTRKFASVSECFEELLRFYGYEFNSMKSMIVRGEFITLMPIEILKGRLVATDPFKPWLNAAYNVTRFKEFQECLRDTLDRIKQGKTFKELLSKSNDTIH